MPTHLPRPASTDRTTASRGLTATEAPLPPYGGGAPIDEPLFDSGLIRDLVGFAIRAVARHRRAALVTLLSVLAAAAAILAVWPRTYVTEVQLLAQRNLVMPVLGNPGRNLPSETDTPTRLASEAILNHDNLVAIIRATDLVSHWNRHRSLPGRLHDRISRLRLGRGPTPDEQVEALVWSLSHKMWVNTGEGTVTIGISWPDPYMAYRIVQTAQENFFEERHSNELALISESIDILEAHAADVNGEIRASLDSMAQVRAAFAPASPRSASPPVRRISTKTREAMSRLESVRRTIADLEQFRSHRLAELQLTLADQQRIYGSAHPQIENTQQMIRGLATDSPQLVELRREEKQLRDQIGDAALDAGAANTQTADPVLAAAALRSLERMQSDSIVNERQQYARSRLKIAVTSYEGLLSRLDAARIELETARGAFKYKYGVLVPAQVPRSPVKPKPLLIIVGGTLLAAVLALFVAVGLDTSRGLIVEPWQVERLLHLDVLGARGGI